MFGWQRRALVFLCCAGLLTTFTRITPVAASQIFPDVPSNASYATAVGELAARGIIRGYADGLYRPGTTVERRQAAATLTRAFGWSERQPSKDFPDRGDTDAELWSALRILADLNVMRGFPDGTAAPAQPLTRQQALSLIVRALTVTGTWGAAASSVSPYTDVAAAHQADVATYLTKVGRIPGASATWLDADRAADRGWYAEILWPAVQVFLQRGGAAAVPATAPTPSPAPTTPTPATTTATSFGVATHFMWHDKNQTSGEIDRITRAGFTTVRFDIGWRWIEPQTKGRYDDSVLQQLDWVLAQLDARGITPIITVIETPAWARPAGTDIFTPPTNRQDYADMMRMLAARYAGRASMTWEIWNEPNLVEFWATGPNAADYADLLRRAYAAVKAVAPRATVLGGSIAFNDRPFLEGMYAAGAGGSFDGLSIHPYTGGRAPTDESNAWFGLRSQITGMHATLAAYGDGAKLLYITEFGWNTDDVSDSTRANYMRDAVTIIRQYTYVRTASVYTISQDDYPGFGLVTTGGVETATWQAYAAASR